MSKTKINTDAIPGWQDKVNHVYLKMPVSGRATPELIQSYRQILSSIISDANRATLLICYDEYTGRYYGDVEISSTDTAGDYVLTQLYLFGSSVNMIRYELKTDNTYVRQAKQLLTFGGDGTKVLTDNGQYKSISELQ